MDVGTVAELVRRIDGVDGWHIQLAADPAVTITLPDGTQLAQPPPGRQAA